MPNAASKPDHPQFGAGGGPGISATTECFPSGKRGRLIHVWKQEPGKTWPYDGQVCVCGNVKFKAGYGAVKP